MPVRHKTLRLPSRGRGLYELTPQLRSWVGEQGVEEAMASVFCRHTSCSLVLMENADPTARSDLERFLVELVPDGTAYEHTLEGADDMPSHIRMALTRSSECIPVSRGRLLLGTWQGLFLWEHRHRPHEREIIFSLTH